MCVCDCLLKHDQKLKGTRTKSVGWWIYRGCRWNHREATKSPHVRCKLLSGMDFGVLRIVRTRLCRIAFFSRLPWKPWEKPSYFWLTAVEWVCFSGHVWVHLVLVAVFKLTWIFAAHFGPSLRLRCVRLLRVLRITRFFDDLRTLGAKLWTSLGFDVSVVWNVGKGWLNSEQGWLKGRVLLKFIDTCHTRLRKVTESWQRLKCKQHAGDRD